jgi:hypothetical protein
MRRLRAARHGESTGILELLIGSIRRECLDHVVVVGERHLRHVLASCQKYYNEVRTHLSLQKDAPVRRHVCRTGRVRSSPISGHTINMFEFEFLTGTGFSRSPRSHNWLTGSLSRADDVVNSTELHWFPSGPITVT